jgi:hypothetical protein
VISKVGWLSFLRAAQAIEHKHLPIHDDEALDALGNNDIRLLAKQFFRA